MAPTNSDKNALTDDDGESGQSQVKDKKAWGICKHIPIVNTLYGSGRAIYYGSKGNREEVGRSVTHALGGLATIGGAIAGGMITIAGAPILVPAICSVVIGGFCGQVVGGGGEVIVDAITDEDFREGTDDQIETRVNNRVLKDIPVIGVAYSAISSAVYLGKGNKKEATQRIKNAAIGTLTSGVSIGVAFGVGRLTSAAKGGVLGDAADEVAAQAIGATDDVVVGTAEGVAGGTAKVIGTPNVAVGASLFAKTEAKPIMQTAEFVARKAFQLVAKKSFQITASKGAEKCTQTFVDGMINDAPFVYQIPKESNFFDCFLNYDKLAGATKNSKEEILSYVISCLCLDYAQKKFPDGSSVLMNAVKTKDLGMIEAVFAFTAPKFLSKTIRLILQEVEDPSYFGLVRYVIQLAAGLSEAKLEMGVFLRTDSAYVSIASRIPKHTCIDSDEAGLKLLSLDGGGMRGLVEIELLSQLEALLPNGSTIASAFDWIGGTSTGGIIALGLAVGFPISECRKLYFELKDTVFSGVRPYSAGKFEALLKKHFGNSQMRDIGGVNVMITVTTGTVAHLECRTITNQENDKNRFLPIWEVARMTSAAPSFFSPWVDKHGTHFYDGGLSANNPTEVLYRTAKAKHRSLKNSTIVSLGSGIFSNRDNFAINVNDSPIGQALMACNGTLKQLFDVFVNQVCKTDGEVVDRMVSLAEDVQFNYYRLTPTLAQEIDLDETDDSKLVNMIWHARAFASRNQTVLKEIVGNMDVE